MRIDFSFEIEELWILAYALTHAMKAGGRVAELATITRNRLANEMQRQGVSVEEFRKAEEDILSNELRSGPKAH